MVSTAQISGLTTRLAGPARLLAARLGQIARPQTPPPPAAVQGGLISARIHVPFMASPSEAERWNEIAAHWAADAAEERWGDLLSALRAADQARTAAPGGRRLASLISQGARKALASALAARDWPAALAEIDRFSAVQSAHPEDYAAAHLLAQAYLDYAWARRNAEPGPGIPREVWKEFLDYTARAETVLDAFDPLEEMSPLLAGSRYLLVRGLEDGETLCRDWYEDWSDLDPTNPEPHTVHAVHLLPHWFGSLADFDAEARAAHERTRHASGASAYALFYLAAAEAMGDLPPSVDIVLFLQGLMDYFQATGCQYRANIVAGTMTELHHSMPTDTPVAARYRQLVGETLAAHLRENLREFQLSAWENGEACVLYAVDQTFGKELARGEHVYLGPEGLTTRLPS